MASDNSPQDRIIIRPEDLSSPSVDCEASTSICSICQCPVEPHDEVTECNACGLPFHQECWEENQGCAAYGCRNVHALKQGPDISVDGQALPQMATPLQQPTKEGSPPPSFLTERPILATIVRHRRPITNSQLPAIGNWICLYCIVVRPILWMMNTTSHFVGRFDDDTELFFCLFSVALETIVTVILVIGGLRLRVLRRSGLRTVKFGLVTFFMIFAFGLFLLLLIVSTEVASTEDVSPLTSTEYLACFLFLIYFAETVIQVMALIWLIQNGHRLNFVS